MHPSVAALAWKLLEAGWWVRVRRAQPRLGMPPLLQLRRRDRRVLLNVELAFDQDDAAIEQLVKAVEYSP